jgi:hypothetical protein
MRLTKIPHNSGSFKVMSIIGIAIKQMSKNFRKFNVLDEKSDPKK